jgi:hypothetical protein
MMQWFIRRRLDAFERDFTYDIGYARDILAAGLLPFRRFAATMGLSTYRRNVPEAPWFAARIVAAMAEDCGPCTQLVVTMAERAGVAPDLLRAILSRDARALPDDVSLAMRFADAVLRHGDDADALRAAIVERWGQAGLVSLAFGITAARMYPTLKYALGHGRACVRVNVGGKAAPFASPNGALRPSTSS